MSIEFIYEADLRIIILRYVPYDETSFIDDKFSSNPPEEIYLRRSVFCFSKNDLINDLVNEQDGGYNFKFAQFDDSGYYKFSKSILGTQYDVFIYYDIDFEEKIFVARRDISIFRRIDEICDEEVFIGGEESDKYPNIIPAEVFNVLIKKFPTSHEMDLFAGARISSILQDYLPTMADIEQNFQNFYEKKEKRLLIPDQFTNIISPEIYRGEIHKYEKIKNLLEQRLDENDNMVEKVWQNFLKEFLLLIFPQYVAILESVKIDGEFPITKREIDFVFVNTDGYIDILELKKPDRNCIFPIRAYRDNFYPSRTLSGAVMQAEKYLLYLKSNVIKQENKLNKTYEDILPENLEIKIRNPRAMLILGRSDDFCERKKSDFEIIKRKYASIADIMSYDDVLARLNNIIASLQRQVK